METVRTLRTTVLLAALGIVLALAWRELRLAVLEGNSAHVLQAFFITALLSLGVVLGLLSKIRRPFATLPEKG